jgi:2,3-dimethylmalate lyase
LLQTGEFIAAPGVFDLLSAKLADRIKAKALYMTGFGTVASHLGYPDAGLATYTDMLDRAAAIVEATSKPLIADGDTGYGGLLNVHHTVRGYEKAGVAMIQLEDQQIPKKCGHTPQPSDRVHGGDGEQDQGRVRRPFVKGVPDPGPDRCAHVRWA